MEKKKILRTYTLFFMFIMLMQFALSLEAEQRVTADIVKEDIAYIYRTSGKIDNQIIDVFTDIGFNVDLIQEKAIPANLDKYSFIFVGDESFHEDIPVNDNPAIVASYRNSEEWGITDRDGASQLGATAPLTVQINSTSVQVYTSAFIRGRLAVPYYFLDKNNKLPAAQQIATAKPTSSGLNLGDVISYVNSGEIMVNNKEQKGNLCFFGIIKSTYWTEEAKDLFINCIEFVSERSLQ